ncbi:MAG TPA: hypothetical protein P5277_04165 [Candidatus Paceibacterota bacterium]|nr:hypothetical protein [Candidatus Paceibacterota bacterium]
MKIQNINSINISDETTTLAIAKPLPGFFLTKTTIPIIKLIIVRSMLIKDSVTSAMLYISSLIAIKNINGNRMTPLNKKLRLNKNPVNASFSFIIKIII